MSQRGLSFGAAAAAYERHRPGYPEWIVDRILRHRVGAGHAALEIGAGTGKATRVFAARDLAVTAIDPDPLMLEELRRHVPASVTVRCSTLEEYPTGERFDLVYAAASLHWTDPTTRMGRIAELLRPGGVVASFGGPLRLADPALRDELEEVLRPIIDTDAAPRQRLHRDHEDRRWPGSEFAAHPAFADVVAEVRPERWTAPAETYLDLLSTVSAYLVLSPGDRAEAFRRVRSVLPDPVEIGRDIWLHLARRVDP